MILCVCEDYVDTCHNCVWMYKWYMYCFSLIYAALFAIYKSIQKKITYWFKEFENSTWSIFSNYFEHFHYENWLYIYKVSVFLTALLYLKTNFFLAFTNFIVVPLEFKLVLLIFLEKNLCYLVMRVGLVILT